MPGNDTAIRICFGQGFQRKGSCSFYIGLCENNEWVVPVHIVRFVRLGVVIERRQE